MIKNDITKRKEELLNNRKKLADGKIPGVVRELMKALGYSRSYYHWAGSETGAIKALFGSGGIRKPSELFSKGFDSLLTIFVPEEYRKSYLYIIDKFNQFQYSMGWYRRSVRSASYVWVEGILAELVNYSDLFLYDTDLEGLLLGNVKDEELLAYCRRETLEQCDNILAAELDLGNQRVKEALRSILLSENNTGRVTTGIIRGIIKSDDEEMHRLLGDFLLAARLQEGVRQAVCEHMDCGTIKAFLTLFEVIEKNNLIRYSSVRRAVCTWIGIFQDNSVDRLTDKMVALMGRCLREPEFRREQLRTEDSVAISCGLWAMGFYEANDAAAAIKELLDHGTRHQKLTASYYNLALEYKGFKEQAAKKMLLEYQGDLELAACYLPGFLPDIYQDVNSLFKDGVVYSEEVKRPSLCPVTNYFKDSAEAKNCYAKLRDIYSQVPKKDIRFSPCIFPWHEVILSKSDMAAKLCFMAWLIQEEEYLDDACTLVGELTTARHVFTRLLFYNPKNRFQQKKLVSLLSNGETYTGKAAYKLIDRLKLEEEDYLTIEEMMKSKRPEVRTRAEAILMKQKDEALLHTIGRLLDSNKEEYRTGGLDMIMELKKRSGTSECYKKAREMAERVENPTGKEKLLLDGILDKDTESNEILNARGFGLFDPDFKMEFEPQKGDQKKVSGFLSLKEKEIIGILKKLDCLVEANSRVEYQNSEGEMCLVGNELSSTKREYGAVESLEELPCHEAWEEFYQKEIKSPEALLQIDMYYEICHEDIDYKKCSDVVGEVYGKGILKTVSYEFKPITLKYVSQVSVVIRALRAVYRDRKKEFEMAVELAKVLISVLSKRKQKDLYAARPWNHSCRVTHLLIFHYILKEIDQWETDEEFKEAFFLKWNLEEFYALKDGIPRYERGGSMAPFWFLKAYSLGIIEESVLYYVFFQNYDMRQILSAVTLSMCPPEERKRDVWEIHNFYGKWESEEKPENSPLWALSKEIYQKLVPMILKVELKRGDSETVFSQYIRGIRCIYGTDILIQILIALGKDTLDRDGYYSYYSSSQLSKKSSMSHLLKVSHPKAGEDGRTLRAALKGTGIGEKRLSEAAMYAPQWIDVIEEYLGWQGMKCGCYYFMAHMNESLDERNKAIIAKYTPLEDRQLQDGAFDLNWFKEAYEKLGNEHFMVLYDAAKYISDGSKHSRARKYADAALGRVRKEDLKARIVEKRNKDLLMSYGILPLDPEQEEQDLLDRYQYLQEFLKESRQFGAQRRSSEARAVEIAMENLSMNAGYQDVMRLTLQMETKLAEQFKEFFEWNQIGENQVRILVDETGKSVLQCKKDEKLLKSIPAKIKKDEIITAMQQANKGLKAQYSRTRQMMEQSMEDRTPFTAREIEALYGNPVVKPVLWNLVYVHDGHMGFLRDGKLIDASGNETQVSPQDALFVAHPVDFYQGGCWHEYQRLLFEQEIRQPFKQVFRELYVKTEEELLKEHSLAFAGNQIQPLKTVGCLKGRRWIADYEEGLQKVYYKDNIIARIYALADWFSPADIEAPVLEWVEFSDRKTFEPLKLKEVPDVIYSEVMRDVDLAVSVAHAGGVDPETSHSTVEMRKAIIEFNLPLFKLSNVTLEGNHAFIKGSLGEYTINLGSGVVHQSGGSMLHVLPVHSQKRGKLFLPFVDEDPKTAEIMSKIVLFAEDKKLKDPYILDQIR